MANGVSFWDRAAKAGLALGGVSVAYILIGLVTNPETDSVGLSVLMSVVNLALWAGKLVLCIYLMNLFMKRYAAALAEPERSSVFKFGALVGVLSALVYSAAYMGYTMIAGPELGESVMAMISQMNVYTPEMISQVEEMLPKIPTIMFFSNLIYCSLFGTIVSAILSKRICPDNPF